jgi:hypothetical protein
MRMQHACCCAWCCRLAELLLASFTWLVLLQLTSELKCACCAVLHAVSAACVAASICHTLALLLLPKHCRRHFHNEQLAHRGQRPTTKTSSLTILITAAAAAAAECVWL